MKKISGLIALLFAAVVVVGCDGKDESIVPATISNLNAEPQEGAILLTWDNPADGDYFYSQIQYVDPLTEKLQKINVSHYTDKYLLKGLYRKNGEYTFRVYAVSSTETFSQSYEEASATALKVPSTVTPTSPVAVPLTVAMLSSDASDPDEGKLTDLIDGNTGTFWHSNWHSKVPFPNYIQVDLAEEVQGVKIKIINRNRSGYTPGDFDIQGSNDGTQWTTLGSVAKGTIPDTASAVYETPVMSVYPATGETFSKIRLSVNSTVSGSDYWCLSEFEIFKISYEIFDPEA